MKKKNTHSWEHLQHFLIVLGLIFGVALIFHFFDPLGIVGRGQGQADVVAYDDYYNSDPESPFWDVDETDPHYYAVLHAYNTGVFDGYADGSFRPYDYINRAELAKVIMFSFTYVIYDNPGNNFGFWDLDTEAWYIPYLYSAYLNGVLSGYPDGSLKPADTVNRAELLKIFLEAAVVPLEGCTEDIYLDVKAGDWYCKYAKFAQDYGLMGADYGFFYGEDSMTRGDVAELFFAYDIFYLGMQ